VSTRLTKKEATEWIPEVGKPEVARSVSPEMNDSRTSLYLETEKIIVTLTLIP